jgi:hypothetical protein
MKKILALLLLLLTGLSSCDKDCVAIEKEGCKDTVPTDEVCQAAFSRWFYDSNENSCKLIGYSGCSLRGFETKQECEECKCK